jgi:hypothetical protein
MPCGASFFDKTSKAVILKHALVEFGGTVGESLRNGKSISPERTPLWKTFQSLFYQHAVRIAVSKGGDPSGKGW